MADYRPLKAWFSHPIWCYLALLLTVSPHLAAAPPQQDSEILFSDSFEEGAEQWNLATGWTIEQLDDGNHILNGAEQRWVWARANLGDDWTDYAIYLRLRLIDSSMQVNFRVSEGRYSIYLDPFAIHLNEQDRFSDPGSFHSLAESTQGSPMGDQDWHNIQIDVQGAQIRVSIDDELVIEYVDEQTQHLSGAISFETGEEALTGGIVQVDDLQVTRLETPPFLLPDGTLLKDNLFFELQRQIGRGRGLINSGRNEEAVEVYRAAISLVETYQNYQEYEEADTIFFQLMQVDAQIGIGNAYAELARLGSPAQREMTAQRDKVLITNPQAMAELYDIPDTALSLLQLAFSNPEEALSQVEAAESFDDDLRAKLRFLLHVIQAGLQLEQDPDTAISILNTALAWATDSPDILYYYRALAFEASGDYENARRTWVDLYWSLVGREYSYPEPLWRDQSLSTIRLFYDDLELARSSIMQALTTLLNANTENPLKVAQANLALGNIYEIASNSILDVIVSRDFLGSWQSLTSESVDYYGRAATAFEQAQDSWYQGEALILLARQQSALASFAEPAAADHATRIQWYQSALENLRHAIALQGSDWPRFEFGRTTFTLSIRAEMGLLGNSLDSSLIDDLLLEQGNVASAMNEGNWQGNHWRGLANARRAWRNGDAGLAWSAISDLQTAVEAIKLEIQQQPASFGWNSEYLLWAEHYLGRSYAQVNRPDLAVPHLEEANRIYQFDMNEAQTYPEWRAQDPQIENYQLLGDSLLALGRYADAINAYLGVDVEIRHPLKDDILTGLADAYQGLNLFESSLPPLEARRNHHQIRWLRLMRDLELAEGRGEPTRDIASQIISEQVGAIDSLLRMVEPLLILNRSEEALINGQRALDLADEIDDGRSRVNAHLRLADVYLTLDDRDNAVPHYETAAELALQANLSRERGRALLGLGRIQMTQELLIEAERTLNRGLQSARNAQDTDTQVFIWSAMGDLALIGDTPNANRAEQNYHEALRLAATSRDPRLQIDALIALGSLQLQSENLLDAGATYHEALWKAELLNDRDAIARIYGFLGRVTDRTGQQEVALRQYVNAVDEVESTQRGFISEIVQTRFAANYAWIYADYIGLLFATDRDEDAFVVSERGRARAFLDQLAAGPIDLHEGAAADLLNQETELRQQLDAARSLLTEAQAAVTLDREYIAAMNNQLQGLERDYSSLLSRMQAENPTLASLTSSESASLSEVQERLDEATTLISYYVTDDRTYVFVVKANSFKSQALDISAAELRNLIDLFRADEQQTTGLNRLYNALIEPIRSQLNTTRLIIVPHNALHYLPFAALIRDDGRYLGEDFALNYLPSASALVLLSTGLDRTGDSVLALGNSQVNGMRSLPFAENEVQEVVSIAGGEAYVGVQASESRLRTEASSASVLHLAVHGTFNQRNPMLSALLLSGDNEHNGRLEVYEIYGLDMTTSTQLVVLSACQTAVGRLSDGDEFMSLNRAFLYAGAPRVITSLWSVDDAATGILMKAFYQARAAGSDYAQALQTAQQSVRDFKDANGSQPYQAPYFWAAFVLTGQN